MTETNPQQPRVDIVIPVYGERERALRETLLACLRQSYPVDRTFVVDDGSPQAVCLPSEVLPFGPQVVLLRLQQNQGISGARNAGIAHSNTVLIACVNTEVIPDSGWLGVCVRYLCANARVGACYTRLVPSRPKRLLTRWRMRFRETKFGSVSGPTPFAPGHAAVFRREALDAVGGFDVRYRLHLEDSDLGGRMWQKGWETHYIAESCCVTTQEDTLTQIAKKELRECFWYAAPGSSPVRSAILLTKWTLIRAARNLAKFRWYFLPVDFALWAVGLWSLTSEEVKHAFKGSRSS